MEKYLHAIAGKIRPLMPKVIWRFMYQIATAFLGPFRFSVETGHLRSALTAKSVDRHGEPLPWYAFPIIEFLRTKDFSQKKVLEFGAGYSSLFWANRAKSVRSYEVDAQWHGQLLQRAPANLQLFLTADDAVAAAKESGPFDIIIVDGMNRLRCASAVLEKLASDGAIIVDNTEYYKDIMDFYASEGLKRVDFWGFAPGTALTQCTSIFWRNECFLFKR
jgi:hypothetical protein